MSDLKHRLLLLSLLFPYCLTAGCATVEQKAGEADRSLRTFFGTENLDNAERTSSHEDVAEAKANVYYEEALRQAKAGKASQALESLRQAADLGHPAAAYELAEAYTNGIGTAVNLEEGGKWLQRATELEEPRAFFFLGANFAAGVGVEQDLEQAAYYFGEAALRGHIEAQYRLGEAFAEGKGVPKDLPWAMRWYGRAAYKGHNEAQFAYGILMAAGRGLPKNPNTAYRWLRLAELGGHPTAAQPRKALEQQISPTSRAGTETWVDAFRPRPTDSLEDPPTVQYVQVRMTLLGFDPGPVDGILGVHTTRAISNYQRDQGLSKTGKISQSLLSHLLEQA